MSYLVLARKWRPKRFAELVAGGDPTPDQQRTLHTLETIDAIHAAMI